MTNAEARFSKSHIRKVYACLAVTCHLHFWQNDRDFLHATAVTRGWNGYRNKSQHRKSTLDWEENSPAVPAGIRTRDLSITDESGALTTELSPPNSRDIFSQIYKRLTSIHRLPLFVSVLSVLIRAATAECHGQAVGCTRSRLSSGTEQDIFKLTSSLSYQVKLTWDHVAI